MNGPGLGLGIGLHVIAAGGYPTDVPQQPLLDLNFEQGSFRIGNLSGTNLAALLPMVGATASGAAITFGPYVAPGTPNLVINGDFAADLTGWDMANDGASTTYWEGPGVAVLNSDGAAGTGGKAGGAGFVQAVALTPNAGYIATVERISGGATFRMGSAAYGTQLGGLAGTVTEHSFGTHINGLTYFYAFRNGPGVARIDNLSIVKADPFVGFEQGGNTIEIEGTTPSVAAGEKCALSLYANTNLERKDLFWNAAGEMRFRVNQGGTAVADLNLGVVPPNTPFKLRAAMKTDGFYAQLNDGPVAMDTSGNLTGSVMLKIGESPAASSSWGDGVIGRVMLHNGGDLAQFFAPTPVIVMHGDSYIGGSGGVVLPHTLANLMGRSVWRNGVGGSTMAQIRDRILDPANAWMRPKVSVFWDGDENSFTTLGEYCDEQQAAIAALGHERFIVIPPCVSTGQTDWTVQDQIRDEFAARWPGNILDWRDVLPIADGVVDPSLYIDGVHLTQAGMDLMASAISAFIDARAW